MVIPPLIIQSSESFETAVHSLLYKQPTYFNISTFCISSMNALDRFDMYDTHTKFRVLTGLPPGIKREEAKGYDELKRYYSHIEFRFQMGHHAKLYVAELRPQDYVILGSKNIGLSKWTEVGVMFPDPILTYRKLFLSWWNVAYKSADKCRKEWRT